MCNHPPVKMASPSRSPVLSNATPKASSRRGRVAATGKAKARAQAKPKAASTPKPKPKPEPTSRKPKATVQAKLAFKKPRARKPAAAVPAMSPTIDRVHAEAEACAPSSIFRLSIFHLPSCLLLAPCQPASCVG